MNVLIVLTSHSELGDTGEKTGLWLEELAAPYYIFQTSGAVLTLASPQGGAVPLDPKSEAPGADTESTRRFKADGAAMAALSSTRRLNGVDATQFDAVFYPGGHGPLWDLVDDVSSIRLIEQMAAAGKPMAFVCHAPAVLLHPKRSDGHAVVEGRQLTGFSNAEEQASGLTDVVPFLLEDRLKGLGAKFSQGAPFEPHVVNDGLLITGQNPASSAEAARRLLGLLH